EEVRIQNVRNEFPANPSPTDARPHGVIPADPSAEALAKAEAETSPTQRHPREAQSASPPVSSPRRRGSHPYTQIPFIPLILSNFSFSRSFFSYLCSSSSICG